MTKSMIFAMKTGSVEVRAVHAYAALLRIRPHASTIAARELVRRTPCFSRERLRALRRDGRVRERDAGRGLVGRLALDLVRFMRPPCALRRA